MVKNLYYFSLYVKINKTDFTFLIIIILLKSILFKKVEKGGNDLIWFNINPIL